MSFPPEVYSRCLLGDYGYPLWTPQLNTELCESYKLEGLKIGDVGILSPNNGSFDVLFNITVPRNEQPYPELVGESFTPVTLSRRDLNTEPDAVPAEYVFPRGSVQLMPGAGVKVHSRDQKPSRAHYEFSLSTEDGAVLILPEGADRCDLKNERMFLDEAIRHGVGWYECATDPKKAGRLINNDSLYLVTGFHKARSWSLGATDQNSSTLQNQCSLTFEVEQIPGDGATARAYHWAVVQGFMGRVGPLSPYEIPNYIIDGRRRRVNQTVFVRGFRITVNRLLLLFKTVSVETPQGNFGGVGGYINNLLWGRPSESTGGGDVTDNEVNQDFQGGHSYADTLMTIDRVPDISQTFHPGDLINRHMLKKEPRAILALTHDSLWIEMLQLGLLELAEFSQEQRLEEVLSSNYQITMENDAVYLQKRSKSVSCEQSEPELPSSALTGDIQSPGISTAGPHPGHVEQHHVKEGLHTPGNALKELLGSITHSDGTVITNIRATGFARGLKRDPTSFYAVVRHGDLEWRTESKPSSANDVVEWNQEIPIPSELPATVRIEVYASFESQSMFGSGKRLRNFTSNVEQLLDRSENNLPLTFTMKDDSIVSSIVVAVKQQRTENDPSISGFPLPAHSFQGTPTDVSSLQAQERDLHLRISHKPLPPPPASPTIPNAGSAFSSERPEIATFVHLTTEPTMRLVSDTESSESPVYVREERPVLTSLTGTEHTLPIPPSKSPSPSRTHKLSVPTGPPQNRNHDESNFEPALGIHQVDSSIQEMDIQRRESWTHWQEQRLKGEQRDAQMQELMGMVSRLLDDQAAARQREEERMQASETEAGVEEVIERLLRHNAEQRVLLNTLTEDSIRQHEAIIGLRAVINNPSLYNAKDYTFSGTSNIEGHSDVGKLREKLRNVQHELGYLMMMKSKYGPGGEFEPDWKPLMTSPPSPPPPFESRPAWRTVSLRPSRRSRKGKGIAITIPEPPSEPRQDKSWDTWQPDPSLAPTPPSAEPTVPGLFGPRSPRDSYFE